MKVVLITTPTRTYAPNTVLPVGIMYLASYLRMNGHEVAIIDVAKTRQDNGATIAELRRLKPDLVGIGGIITSYAFVKALVREIKAAAPHIPVVIGGHISIDNISPLMCEVGCDYVVVGYGEKVLLYLVEYLSGSRPLRDIPGLSYRESGSITSNSGIVFFDNIDEIPLPAYDLVDMEYYVSISKANSKVEAYLQRTGKKATSQRSAFVVGARGCTDKCSFCVHEFEHKGFYVHSTDYVMKNIAHLYEKYGVRIFGMGEDLFLYNPNQARSFAQEMNKSFPDAYFSCSIRADFITPELVDALTGSNCAYLAYGFESGSDHILAILGKRMTRSINIKAYRLLKQTDIEPGCSFMVGTPDETDETIAETISAIKEARVGQSAVFFTTPYPGSRLYKWCKEKRLIKDDNKYLEEISDRDAGVLTINFTPYPDFIVKLMRLMVLNALEDNCQPVNGVKKVPIYKFIIKRIAAPFIYKSYFLLRRACSRILPQRKRSGGIILNDEGTVRLLSDRISDV